MLDEGAHIFSWFCMERVDLRAISRFDQLREWRDWLRDSFRQDQRYSTGLISGAYGGEESAQLRGVGQLGVGGFARCAFSVPQQAPFGFHFSVRCCRKDMARGESTSRPGKDGSTTAPDHAGAIRTRRRWRLLFCDDYAPVEHGGLLARCLTAAHQRGEQKAAFVQKHQLSLQLVAFF